MSVSKTRKGIILAGGLSYQTASASAPVTNTYATIIASTASPIFITGAIRLSSQARTVTFATGGAGAEVAFATLYFPTTSYGPVCVIALPYPIRVPVSTRVAIKYDYGDSDATTIVYVPESSVI